MKIDGLRCSTCDVDEIIAIWPGNAGVQGELFWLMPSRPTQCWCEMCWQKRYGPKLALLRSRSRAKASAPDHQ